MKLLFFALLSSLSLTVCGEGMYKWVDDKGVTHYSESPPPDDPTGKKATKLDLKPSGPAAPTKEFDWKAKELDSRTQNVQKVQEERAKAVKDAEVAERRKALCMQAMRQVNLYQQQVPVYSMNDKGERVYIEDADREAKLTEARDRMLKYCD